MSYKVKNTGQLYRLYSGTGRVIVFLQARGTRYRSKVDLLSDDVSIDYIEGQLIITQKNPFFTANKTYMPQDEDLLKVMAILHYLDAMNLVEG
jgi:hypothetical protein